MSQDADGAGTTTRPPAGPDGPAGGPHGRAPTAARSQAGDAPVVITPPRGYAAIAGVLAVAVALAVTELAAGSLPDVRSLIVGVGDRVIDTVPGWLERAAIAVLGRADKPVLIVGILATCAVLGALLGPLATRRFPVTAAVFVAAGALGVGAGLEDPQSTAAPVVVVAVAGVVAGTLALRALLQAATPRRAGVQADGGMPSPARDVEGVDRRAFVRAALAATAVAVIGGVGSRLAVGRERITDLRTAISIPRPARAAPPPPPGADLELPGLSPLYVDNDDFYRIDTALTVPQVDPLNWSLDIEGMVERPFTLSYEELLAMPQVEADITLACVSNEVGGDLVGNARWQGVPLRELLERAGVEEEATQVMGRSVDGFTAGFPTVTALNEPDAMIALAMNGEPLPAAHGFPARLVVPGLYGYVSATKWLSAIELTTFADAGYWIPRGWAREGPIKTQSRIDVPRASSTVSAGRQPVAGVAWAPTRGIERVEVRVDDGPWTQAELAASLDVDSWRQWIYRWDAAPGEHRITVRATDGAGETQTVERSAVAPDGATGHHTITVDVQPA